MGIVDPTCIAVGLYCASAGAGGLIFLDCTKMWRPVLIQFINDKVFERFYSCKDTVVGNTFRKSSGFISMRC